MCFVLYKRLDCTCSTDSVTVVFQLGSNCLLLVLKEHIEVMPREHLSAHHTQLFTIFSCVLDVRNVLQEVSCCRLPPPACFDHVSSIPAYVTV